MSDHLKPLTGVAWLARGSNVALLLAAIFLLLAAGAAFLSYKHYRVHLEHTLASDYATAALFGLMLEAHTKRIIRTMESYANRTRLFEAARQKNAKKAAIHLREMSSHNPDMDSIVMTDPEGTLWASHPFRPDVTGKNYSHRDWYAGVRKGWKPYVSDVVLRVTGEKDTAIQIAVPVADDKGRVAGILLNTQRTRAFSALIKRAPREEGLSYSLVDRRGMTIYSSRYAFERALAPYPFFEAYTKLLSAQVKSFRVSDPTASGAKRYISFAAVSGLGWQVFVGRDQRSLVGAAVPYMLQIGVIALLLFALSTLSLLYFRKRALTELAMERLVAQQSLLASETRFRELFNNMASGVALFEAVNDGADFTISDINPAGRKMTNVADDVAGRGLREVFGRAEITGFFRVLQEVWQTGLPRDWPVTLYKDNDLKLWMENYACRLPSGQLVVVFDDVTKQKQASDRMIRQSRLLSAINRLFTETLRAPNAQSVAETCLSVASELTSSPMGFIGRINADGCLDMYAISHSGWDACRMEPGAAQAAVASMEIRGIWGQVILRAQPLLLNDPAACPERVGLPEGHPPITSFLGAPLADSGKVIGLIALANREGGYTAREQEDLEALALAFAETLRRGQAEDKIRQMNAELERRIAERTAQLERLNKHFVNRELKMRELKARIAELENKDEHCEKPIF